MLVPFDELKVGNTYTVIYKLDGSPVTTGELQEKYTKDPIGYSEGGPGVKIGKPPYDGEYDIEDFDFELAEPVPEPVPVSNPAPVPKPAAPLPYDAAQAAFSKGLSPAEREALSHYAKGGYLITTPLLTGAPSKKDLTEFDPLIDYGRRIGDFPGDKKIGVIPRFLSAFVSAIRKAPKLTDELNVFRGIHSDRGLDIQGNNVLSTSRSEGMARYFIEGQQCCMLNIKVKPGVRVISIETLFPDSPNHAEQEMLICPPFKAQIVDGGKGVKNVTITPVESYRGGRRKTRKHKRRTRSTRDLRSRKTRRARK